MVVAIVNLFRGESLYLTDSQRATISPDAQKVLDVFNYNRLPGFIPISDKMFEGARAGISSEDAKSKKIAEEYGIKIRKDTLAGLTVYYLTPSGDYNKNAIGFYTHGGGFVMGSALDFPVIDLARRLNAQIVSVEYGLAPEAKFPAAVSSVLQSIRNWQKQMQQKKYS